ncbi:MAG: hypothetical protein U0457_19585 [Candidatus Sericytochromatia bacterium]
MIVYNEYNITKLTDNDLNYLSELKKIILNDFQKERAEYFLNKYSTIPINGLVRDLELDIKGYFKLKHSETMGIFLKEKFSNLSNQDKINTFITRLELMKEGKIILPESIFYYELTHLNFEDKLIPIKELNSENFNYIIYETLSEPKEHYIEFVYGGHFLYTRIFKLEKEDSDFIQKSKAKNKFEKIVSKYRK